jgi:hypothetical protein
VIVDPQKIVANLDAFYAADERRKRSGELDFGVMWTARPRETWPTFRVSFIRDTREFYAYSHRDGSFEILGTLPEILPWMSEKAVDPYADAEIVMSGWVEEIHRGGLPWARERIRSACVEAWRDVEARP